MVNPTTGQMMGYEEYWRDEGVVSTEGEEKVERTVAGADAIIEGGDARGVEDGIFSAKGMNGDEGEGANGSVSGGGGGAGSKASIVLTLADEAAGTKGMVVRVGQWCQGLIKVRGEVALERWKWSPGEEDGETAKTGGWQRVARIGRLFLPCALAFEPARVVEGSQVEYGDYKWEVKEVYEWT